ncbi:MAG: flagellar hook-basal body complex protein FliE [Gammaproteobacteria bacterium]|nr:flagellar hook-basal body complex protein FliE [Gammaproteobacteria bacterium]
MSNSIDSNVLLAQLRTMAAQAGLENPNSAAVKNDDAKTTDFTEVLKTSIHHVNETSTQASELAKAFERGEQGVELSQVMIEMQKARVSFETLSQVRNKVVSAYQEIMNMPL